MILIQSDLCRVLATITFFEKLRRLMIHPLESVELVVWGCRGHTNPSEITIFPRPESSQAAPNDVGNTWSHPPGQAHDWSLTESHIMV